MNEPIFCDQTTKLQPVPSAKGTDDFGFSSVSPFYMEGGGRDTKKLGKLVSTTAGAGKQEQGVG